MVSLGAVASVRATAFDHVAVTWAVGNGAGIGVKHGGRAALQELTFVNASAVTDFFLEGSDSIVWSDGDAPTDDRPGKVLPLGDVDCSLNFPTPDEPLFVALQEVPPPPYDRRRCCFPC